MREKEKKRALAADYGWISVWKCVCVCLGKYEFALLCRPTARASNYHRYRAQLILSCLLVV